MAIKARFMGREKVVARLRKLAPEIETNAAQAQLEGAQELAGTIQARAPTGSTGEYRESIQGDKLANRPGESVIGIRQTKDRNATGVFAKFTWRWLEFGTRSHVQPRNPRVGYEHPGSAAQPHIFPTYRAMKKRIRRKVATAINRAVRKVQGK